MQQWLALAAKVRRPLLQKKRGREIRVSQGVGVGLGQDVEVNGFLFGNINILFKIMVYPPPQLITYGQESQLYWKEVGWNHISQRDPSRWDIKILRHQHSTGFPLQPSLIL